MVLGIGIITYKRPKSLVRTAGAVMWHTKSPYYLVVADDGGEDDTVAHCKTAGVTVITGKNRGVCWNKNRALNALSMIGADPIILLEDDCYPYKIGWDLEWIEAASKFHHVNYAHTNWPTNWCRGGSGKPHDPWLTWEITGQATITTHAALGKVGFLNTRFKGYGYGHINWTERFCKAGYIERDYVPCLNCGLWMEDERTYRNTDEVNRNYYVANELRQSKDVYCAPWQNAQEMQEFSDEIYTGLRELPLEVRNARHNRD